MILLGKINARSLKISLSSSSDFTATLSANTSTFSKQILSETGFDFLNADEIEKELGSSKLQAGKEFF